MSKKWVARRLASRRRGTPGATTRQGVGGRKSGSGHKTRSGPAGKVGRAAQSGRELRHWLPLVCHPTSPAPPACQMHVRWAWTQTGDLALDYRLAAPRRALVIPPRRTASRQDGLWRHSCCEAFLGVRGESGYREFNFSPSGEWACYAFADYRVPLAPPEVTRPDNAPHGRCQRHRHLWRLRARVPARLLPQEEGGHTLVLGLTAVVEALGGGLSYWALAHPAPVPDFHHPEGRLLVLASP